MLPNLPLLQRALCAFLVIVPFLSQAQCWPRSQKLLPAPTFNTSESFGASIDYEENIAVVAAPQSDTLHSSSGVVYVFEFKNGVWNKIASLTPSDHRIYQNFGQQVVIQNDYIFVADPRRQNDENNSGVIYIYKKPLTGWHDMAETSILTPTHPYPYHFGTSMAVFENTLLIGASYTTNENNITTGAAFMFELQGSVWTQIATLKSPHPASSTFGSNVALAKNTAVVAADDEQRLADDVTRGAVYIFEKSSTTSWTNAYPVAKLTESSSRQSLLYLGGGLAIDESRETVFSTNILSDATQPYKTIYTYKKPSAGWKDMTETSKYLGSVKSRVYNWRLRFEEPYLYSGGGPTVEIFTPDSNNEWTLTSPAAKLTSENFNLQQQFGEDLAVYKEHVLVSAPSRVTSDRDTLITPAFPAISEFIVPATGWLPGKSFPERSFTYLPVTATEYSFGVNVDIEGDIAIVGAPRDNISKTSAGAVYIYQLTGYNWNKIATLTPSDGEPNDYFGRSISIDHDHIAVGVSNKDYRDETGKIRDFNLGAVYIFKKPASGWTSMHESYKIVQSENKLDYTDNDRDDDNLGITVDLDYPYLIASRFDNGSRPNFGSVLVFKLSEDSAVLEATLNPSFRDAINNFGEALCIRGNTIAIGCGTTRFWGGERNVVFMYERNGEQWNDATETTTLSPSDDGDTGYLSGIAFGKSIDMTDDGSQIIIGAPGWFDGTILQTTDYFKGAAYIFERPADGWTGTIKEKARLTIPNQVPYACMGVSVYIEDRYAVVGTPQNFFYTYSAQNPGPGKVYFYQKPEDGWKYKLPDKIIQGDESGAALSDYFGSAVKGVYGFLMIGAFADDNQKSVDAGSVYVYTEYPFINPAETPVCENAGAIQLTAVPAGGTWKGNGIPDISKGIFQPSLAGMGTHKISYKVDGCDASNTVLIGVKEIPKAVSIAANDSLFFCGKLNIPLSVIRKNGFAYTWWYGENGTSYAPVASNVSSIQATKSGYYKLTVSNECASVADTVWLGDLLPDAGKDFAACASDEVIQLNGNYTAGTWSGAGISASGLFDLRKIGTGAYQLHYSVSPHAGCIYTDTVTAQIYSLPDITIRPEGEESFCYTGKATLATSAIANAKYTWYFGSTRETMSPMNEHSAVLLAEKKGFYSVVVSDNLCSKEVSYQLVLPKFAPQINPSGAISFCHDQLTMATAETIPDAQYTWFRYVDGVPETLGESTGSFSKAINESGVFKLRIESHECVFESKEIRTTKIPADSIFIPNVITPNGDQWNEGFEVYTEGIADFSIRIFSRHGQEIWSGRKGSTPWNATNASSGVYFWTLSYRSQCSNNKEQKGWIQVLK